MASSSSTLSQSTMHAEMGWARAKRTSEPAGRPILGSIPPPITFMPITPMPRSTAAGSSPSMKSPNFASAGFTGMSRVWNSNSLMARSNEPGLVWPVMPMKRASPAWCACTNASRAPPGPDIRSHSSGVRTSCTCHRSRWSTFMRRRVTSRSRRAPSLVRSAVLLPSNTLSRRRELWERIGSDQARAHHRRRSE